MSKASNTTQSFSSRIKSEISQVAPRSMTERQAVIAGVFCTATSEGDNKPAHEARLTKDGADYIISLLKKENIKAEKEKLQNARHEYKVTLPSECLEEFDKVYGICFTEGGLEVLSNDMAFSRSFLRGAYLSCGYCNDPNKAYRIELHLHNQGIVNIVYIMLEGENIKPSVTVRGNAIVLYFSNGDAVSDFMGIIGATSSMLEFENIRATKEVMGNVSRTVNCDSGNTKRQADAAAYRTELINRLLNSPKVEELSPQLLEAAKIHQENSGLSITELGKLMNPPLGKSGMNHRLNKIIEIAKTLN